jgi:hypothetical protein
MKRKPIFTFLIILLIVSCKDLEQKTNDKIINENTQNFLSITLNAKVLKDDSFQVFYKYENEAPFLEENSKWVEFEGSVEPQQIVFNLPENEIPNFIRVDLGVNKNQSPIVFNSLKLNYQGKEQFITGNELSNFMIPNPCLEVSSNNLEVILITKEFGGSYDPFMYSELTLQKLLESIY